ncbi:MAG: hypothetical protein K8R36_18275, partial [Planctomycetales bacterium]|nr:hypothetical protein [Planctomycetales bacterium]
PMFDCFTDKPDLTPFASVASNIPLDKMNPGVEAIKDNILKADALVSSQLNFRQIDRAPEDVLNRILWRAMKGSRAVYPEWAIGTSVDDDDE